MVHDHVFTGNQATTRKKQVKVLEKDRLLFIDGQSSGSSEKESSNICVEENIDSHSIQLKNDISSGSLDLTVSNETISFLLFSGL